MTKRPVLWVRKSAKKRIDDLFRRWHPLETGGILLGYWDELGKEAVVVGASGPGPRAVHARDRYVPDQRFDAAVVARAYAHSDRRHGYLGDWHTHPGGRATLSEEDRSTLRRIAEYEPARCAKPIMLIAFPGEDGSASFGAFAYRSTRLPGSRKTRAARCTIEQFE